MRSIGDERVDVRAHPLVDRALDAADLQPVGGRVVDVAQVERGRAAPMYW